MSLKSGVEAVSEEFTWIHGKDEDPQRESSVQPSSLRGSRRRPMSVAQLKAKVRMREAFQRERDALNRQARASDPESHE